MIHTFTAIDFETANKSPSSICQTGIVRVEGGEITHQQSWLSKPPNNWYLDDFTNNVHGISAETTANSPNFGELWGQMRPFIEGHHVVAHNGFAFDFPCLRQTLAYWNIAPPSFTGHCTYQLFGAKLSSLCQDYHIELNHHNALSDALACAKLFMIHQGIA